MIFPGNSGPFQLRILKDPQSGKWEARHGPVAAAVSAIAGAAAAVAQRWPRVGSVPVWTAASAASGGLLIAPGWPGAGRYAS